MLTVFCDFEGLIHHECLPYGQTENEEYYLKGMNRLRQAVRTKRTDLWRGEKWLLRHDHAPVHSSLSIHDFLTKHERTLIPQPPFLPDLAPADISLFIKLESVLKG